MDVLFIHPNFPGQYLRLAARLAKDPHFEVYAIGDQSWMSKDTRMDGVTLLSYEAPEEAHAETHAYVKNFAAAVLRGQKIMLALLAQKHEGFEPDVIYVHPGWGDGLFLKELFPNTTIIGLFEYFYHARGADVGFDPEFPLAFNDLFRVRMLNTVQLHALDACDYYIAPTQWQKSQYPDVYQKKLSVLHEGIDTSKVVANPEASISLSNGLTLKAGDEVLTFVSRCLEPYRGFHSFMRSLPEILAARPNCQVLIVGGDKHHYGPAPTDAESWKDKYLSELSGQLDRSRIHFLGMLSFEDYLSVLQISRAHVYLTYPFILSWSMMEALAAGCCVIASNTPPVRELIEDGKNGLLVPFFDYKAIAAKTIAVLASPRKFDHLTKAASSGIKAGYDFEKVILPQHLALLNNIKALREPS